MTEGVYVRCVCVAIEVTKGVYTYVAFVWR